jgi:HD-GYP domain-containing protein (c-di-GMP phosphodiesterase class II)
MSDRYDEHYIASIAALGDSHVVATSQAIFTRNGIKLIDAGTRINSAMRERLIQHKLIPDIDQCLVVENGVTNASLRDCARKMLDVEPQFQFIRAALPGLERLLNAFYGMQLNAPLAFKLTVAREQHPQLFRHSIQVTLFALFLGIKDHLTDRELASVAAAGMCHDLGELHIDPDIMHTGDRLDTAGLRQICVHPTTAFLILQVYPQYHPDISTAVLEHHERMDGSGYPRGIKGEEISPLGQVIMLAEVIATLAEKSWSTHGASRLTMMLKMNRRRFAPTLIDHLGDLMHGDGSQAPDNLEPVSAALVTSQLNQLAEIFRLWHSAYQSCTLKSPEAAESPLIAFVGQRVLEVERTLLETGFQPDELTVLITSIQDDAAVMTEMQLMVRESRWLIGNVISEAQRRWNDLLPSGQSCAVVEGWIEQTLELLQDQR